MHRVHLLVAWLCHAVHVLELLVLLELLLGAGRLVLHAAHIIEIWLLLLLALHFQGVMDGFVVEHIQNDLHIVFPDALFFDDVLHLEGVNTHTLCLANQLLLEHRLVEVELLLWVDLLPETELRGDLFPLFFLGWAWLDVALLEVVSQLERYLLKCLLCKLEIIARELAEWHKLNNITAHVPFVFVGVQRRHIGIQLVHCREVSITNSDNDDTQRVVGAANNFVYCFLEVVDDAVGDNKQNLVALVLVGDLACLAAAVYGVEDLAEVSRSIEINFLDGILVCHLHAIDAVALGQEDVAVESKAMRWSVQLLMNLSTKSVCWYLLVGVIVLKDVADCSQSLEVLVLVGVPVVEGVAGRWRSVRQSKINRNVQVDLATTEDVLEEVH